MKTKTSLWLGVCTLVLCLGVMTFGVYSAISANLNMSGKLGFNMHNATVTVSGTIYNLAEMPEGQNYANRIDKPIERTIMGGENTTTASISLGDMYFFQYDSSNVYDIIIELSFINVSSTAIKATIPAPTVGTGVTIVTDSASGYTTFPLTVPKIEINGTYTVKFALHLDSLNALANNVNFSWNNIKFEEYVKPLQGNNIKYNLTATDCSVNVAGTKMGYSNGGTASSRENIQMDNGTVSSTTKTVNVGTLNFANTPKDTPIVLTLTATNKSNTKVASMIVIDEITDANYTIEYAMDTDPDAATTAYEGAVILDTSTNKSVTFTITLTSTNPAEISTNDLIISADFTKYTTIQSPYNDETQGLIYTLNDAGNAWSVKGDYAVRYDSAEGEYYKIYNNVKPELVITESLFGIPVVEIEGNAFGRSDGYFGFSCGVTSVSIPDSVTSIGSSAFSYCRSLTSITIPDSVTSIGDYAFYGCTGLTSITIPDSVTSIGDDAFSNINENAEYNVKDNLKYLGNKNNPYIVLCGVTDKTLESYTIDSKTKFIHSYAFSSCSSLTSITIPDSVTSIGNYAFNNCDSLTSVTIPDSVTSIGYYAFDNCTSLTSVNISSIESWCGIDFGNSSANPLYYAHNLYLNGTLVTSLNIPNTVKEIKNYAFSSCSSLTNITIPDSVTSIGDSAFRFCDSLTCVTIPNSVTSIGNSAFQSCRSLTSVSLGNGVTNISDYTFQNCTSLESVTFEREVPPTFGSSVFDYCSSNLTIHVPSGCGQAYKNALPGTTYDGKVTEQ